ncbi:RAQPRD family integrative conjugative element protein [Kosakonia sp. MUSA4]|uniref:integrative conjugative element protein, RAQPRD family n=1 Tax=Kosakonia sp. MUSA4 TaxID=2067958 RepID=UPI00159B50C8|nr:RAQPRD family integrative conjugative element protein [Kosakonia sp. MUSA4]QJT79302.1 raqprd family integrative conjugative element protein [Kosakonia sp. MUSA4]
MHCQKAILLFISLSPALASASPESAQLAQTLKQLDGIQVTLERARQSASADARSRYYFDYPQAQQDIQTIRQGINHYLSPARAQPREVLPLSADYQRENAGD